MTCRLFYTKSAYKIVAFLVLLLVPFYLLTQPAESDILPSSTSQKTIQESTLINRTPAEFTRNIICDAITGYCFCDFKLMLLIPGFKVLPGNISIQRPTLVCPLNHTLYSVLYGTKQSKLDMPGKLNENFPGIFVLNNYDPDAGLEM